MSLSCSTGDGDFAWYYTEPDDFTTLQTKRRRRCSSCKSLIDKGSVVLQFDRMKYAETDIEVRIHGAGGEIGMTPMFMCESCGDQWFNLTALKFCIAPNENVPQLLKEYVEEYGKGSIT